MAPNISIFSFDCEKSTFAPHLFFGGGGAKRKAGIVVTQASNERGNARKREARMRHETSLRNRRNMLSSNAYLDALLCLPSEPISFGGDSLMVVNPVVTEDFTANGSGNINIGIHPSLVDSAIIREEATSSAAYSGGSESLHFASSGPNVVSVKGGVGAPYNDGKSSCVFPSSVASPEYRLNGPFIFDGSDNVMYPDMASDGYPAYDLGLTTKGTGNILFDFGSSVIGSDFEAYVETTDDLSGVWTSTAGAAFSAGVAVVPASALPTSARYWRFGVRRVAGSMTVFVSQFTLTIPSTLYSTYDPSVSHRVVGLSASQLEDLRGLTNTGRIILLGLTYWLQYQGDLTESGQVAHVHRRAVDVGTDIMGMSDITSFPDFARRRVNDGAVGILLPTNPAGYTTSTDMMSRSNAWKSAYLAATMSDADAVFSLVLRFSFGIRVTNSMLRPVRSLYSVDELNAFLSITSVLMEKYPNSTHFKLIGKSLKWARAQLTNIPELVKDLSNAVIAGKQGLAAVM